MFDLGWSEMAIIMLVALIVIGPKDLPKVARTIGKWTAKARSMARDFQRSLDDMAREAELDELKSTVEKAHPRHIRREIERSIDPEGEIDNAFDVEDRGGRRTKTNKSPGTNKSSGGRPAIAGKSDKPASERGETGGGEAGGAGSAAPGDESTTATAGTAKADDTSTGRRGAARDQEHTADPPSPS